MVVGRVLMGFACVCLVVAGGLATPMLVAGARQPVGTQRVLVLLAGAPATSNPGFQRRSEFTHHRLRFDASLSITRQYVNALSRYQDSEISFLARRGIELQTRWRFHAVLNGFGALVPTSQLATLRREPNIRAVIPERQFNQTLDRSVRLINAPLAWEKLGGASEAGRGTYIANIDSGIDIAHPCFRDAGFPRPPYGLRTDSPGNRRFLNNKVVVARAFGNNPNKRYSAQDVQGHGTFTASIAACDANTVTPLGTRISGVAAGAYLLNYNVFPAGSSGPYDDQIIAAVDAALLDAADVANLSLGSPQGTGDLRLDPEVAAIQSAERAGLTVVVAAGNAGPTPQSISSPGDAPDAITVGAVSNSRGVYSSVAVGGPGAVPPALQTVRAQKGSSAWSGIVGPSRLVDVGLARRPHDDPRMPAADDFAGKSLRGRIALIERGNGNSPSLLLVRTKVANAAAAGALGAVVYDKVDEFSLAVVDQGPTKLPVSFVSLRDGQAIRSWRRAHARATLTMRSAMAAYDEKPDLMATFSSPGYTSGYGIKPDLVAPGQDIYAATQKGNRSGDMYDPSGFTSQSGTSFAAPHVAGVAALVRQRHPAWTSAMVKEVVVDTAGSQTVSNASGAAASAMQAGAGMLDASSAISAAAFLAPTQATFGQVNTAYGAVQRRLRISLHDAGSGAGPWQFRVRPLRESPLLTISVPASVTLSVNGQVAIDIRASIPSEVPSGDYDGYIEAAGSTGSIHIPYFLHIVHQRVTQGTILLVDATSSRFRSGRSSDAGSSSQVATYYERALRALHLRFTYWDEGRWGSPSLNDARSATSVMYFTGNNVNGYSARNSDPEALSPPLGPVDLDVLHSYLVGGGRALVSGIGAALSDPYWLSVVMGTTRSSRSIFDTISYDPQRRGGVSPGRPSAAPDGATGVFAGLRDVDLGPRGDGVHDNAGIYNPVAGFIGVPALKPVRGVIGSNLIAYGRPALKAVGTRQATDVAISSSDEPSLSRSRQYRGRSVFLGFGFEGINDSAGYATRAQVLSRVVRWFDDVPRATVQTTKAEVGIPVRLASRLVSNVGAQPVAFAWQIDTRHFVPTTHVQTATLNRRGRYRIRVQITDSLGHVAVSGWKALLVR